MLARTRAKKKTVPRRRLLPHHLVQHQAHVVAQQAEHAVEVHPVLRLLEVVAHDGERVGAEEVAGHELLRGLDVGAEADAEHGEAAAAGEEVPPFEVSGGLDGSHDL